MRRWGVAAFALLVVAGAAYGGAGLLTRWREASMPEVTGGGVRVLRGGAEAELSGPLGVDLAPALRAALGAGARTLQLDSPGGSVAAARALAAIVRAAGVDTAATDAASPPASRCSWRDGAVGWDLSRRWRWSPPAGGFR